ncbi:putative alanine dehydrogenase [Candidatus Nitrososphaera gargensis Ga9.2]|uniref:Putative alanine dehydrogenase n=1 Tax=Nitrososphaera gargensis (strain Ga9.2) TaxID=1237085 RepID=K0IEL8_NITGG|nr:NAD(P)-dependent oxidoreductase [Candidatus Nitrososphaera gargensis]AFU58195.1 putative alanine dehydrogenase [Candidatus Nitrososphaera gargensis Ga9.2]
MIIGIPREVKDYENRVALTPRSVSSLVGSGSKVLVETQAGAKSGFSDDEYSSAGATVVGSQAELYGKADLIVKVKEIQVSKSEHERIRPEHTIFGFNHFESSRELTDAAVRSRATFISFEKVVDERGQTPLLMPMSRIAGTVSGIWAGFFHNYAFKHDKSIRLKTGADQVKSKFVEGFEHIVNVSIDNELKRMLSLHDKMAVIFGGGNVGEMAARVCSALGAKVTIVEKREARRKYLQELKLPKCSVAAVADRDILRGAYVIIGSTYDKEKADRVIDEKLLKEVSEMRKKIIIDVAVDQGGNFPYINPSGEYSPSSTGTILNPAQTDYFGNIFIRVPNIPSIVPRYASTTLSAIIAEYIKDIVNNVPRPELVRAISIKGGKVLDEAIIKAHNLKQ